MEDQQILNLQIQYAYFRQVYQYTLLTSFLSLAAKEKSASGSEKINQDQHQEKPVRKPIPHQGKRINSTIRASGATYDSITGRFNREDPLEGNINTPPSLHRYMYANANPTYYIDPDGRYAEAGHYYTTLIVAEAVGFSARDAMTLAFFSQLPDEVDEFDAIELRKGDLFGGELGESIGVLQPFLHALLSSGISETETNLTRKALLNSRDDLQAAGLLIHRLGDTFSHRQINDERYLYSTGNGHGGDGAEPDIIQRRPELYQEYVRNLTETLAQLNGLDEDTTNEVVNKVLSKTKLIASISNQGEKKDYSEFRGEFTVLKDRPGDVLQRESVNMARKILKETNDERIAKGLDKIELFYRPESNFIHHFTPFDRDIGDVLVNAMKNSNYLISA